MTFYKTCIISIFLLIPFNLYGLESVPVYSEVPFSSAPVINEGSFTKSSSFPNNSQAYWIDDNLTIEDEKNVFQHNLKYISSSPEKNWEMKMGKGGQFYSIITDLGQLIGRQHNFHSSHSRWNDAVLQSVVTNTGDPRVTSGCGAGCDPNLSENKNSDMNQAGTYVRDGLTQAFYSPMLRSENISKDEIRSIIWTPPSALPSTFQSGILYDQRVRNMGGGVVEITQLIHNFGPDELENRQSVPWVVLGSEHLDSYHYSDINNVTTKIPNREWVNGTLDIKETQGWIMFLNDSSNTGISFVTGGEKYNTGDSKIWRKSDYRIGDLKRPQWEDSEFILSARRSLNIRKGESVFFRYYIIYGNKDDMVSLSNQYSAYADYGFINYTERSIGESELLKICSNGERLSSSGCTNLNTIGYLYDYPINGSKPVFVLQNSVGKYIYSSDPYAISRISDSNPGKFYDGNTKYIDFLGWTTPESMYQNHALDEYFYVSIDSGFPFSEDFINLDGYTFSIKKMDNDLVISNTEIQEVIQESHVGIIKTHNTILKNYNFDLCSDNGVDNHNFFVYYSQPKNTYALRTKKGLSYTIPVDSNKDNIYNICLTLKVNDNEVIRKDVEVSIIRSMSNTEDVESGTGVNNTLNTPIIEKVSSKSNNSGQITSIKNISQSSKNNSESSTNNSQLEIEVGILESKNTLKELTISRRVLQKNEKSKYLISRIDEILASFNTTQLQKIQTNLSSLPKEKLENKHLHPIITYLYWKIRFLLE